MSASSSRPRNSGSVNPSHLALALLATALIFFITWRSHRPASLQVQVEGYAQGTSPVLYFANGESQPLQLDSTGRGRLLLNLRDPAFVTLNHRYIGRTFYLRPGARLSLRFADTAFARSVQVEGTVEAENRYLVDYPFTGLEINDTELSEAEFLARAEALWQGRVDTLQSLGLPRRFCKAEALRLHYVAYKTLPAYPVFHRRITQDNNYLPSQAYVQKLTELAVMEEAGMQTEAYTQYLTEAVPHLARRFYPQMGGVDRIVRYAQEHQAPPAVMEFLVDRFVTAAVKQRGAQAMEQYEALHARHVKSAKKVEAFARLCAQFKRLAAGMPAPSWAATDVEGRSVSLQDLAGQYVYIDVWATWCGPCQAEIPHLQKLEARYEGRPLRFVSLSCDKDRAAWEAQVRSGMGGIQLWLTEEDGFIEALGIRSIPRFVLIDPQGNFVSANMTRPSDPATIPTLDALLAQAPQ